MQFVKRKENSKFLHQMEKPRTRKTKEVYLECEDWLPAVVDLLNANYDVKVPVGGVGESGEEEINYYPAEFTYECYDTDRGYILLWTKWFNIGEVWRTKFEGLAGAVEVKEGEDVPPWDTINSMADEVLEELKEANENIEPGLEFPIEVVNHKTGELVVS
jgi:hypothetical protein